MISKDIVWKNFFDQGQIDTHSLLPQISDSWIRCLQNGVNPDDGKSRNVLENQAVVALLEKNHDILSIARRFMINLYRLFKNSGFILVLTDSNGYVMDSFGDSAALASARSIRFMPGARWSEADVGTNAISVALTTGAAVQLSGAEHYCRKHHWWTCSAAPIYGQQGELIAVLDLSGPAKAASSHTLGMVAAAANAITMQYNIQFKERELAVMNKRLTSVFNTMSDGLVIFDRFGIARELNPIAKALLGAKGVGDSGFPVAPLLGDRADLIAKLLKHKETYFDIECQVNTDKGLNRCVLSGETIVDEQGLIDGGIITLRSIDKVHRLINQFSGNYTTFKFSDIIGCNGKLAESVHQASVAAGTMANIRL